MKTSYIVAIIVIAILIAAGAWFASNTNSSLTGTSTGEYAASTTNYIDGFIESSSSATSTQTSTSTIPTRVTVKMSNFAFSPATVTIKRGGTVTWTNEDTAAHDVTSTSGAFASASLAQGRSYTHTFSTAGTFPYYCSVHPNMKGTVIVQ